MANQTHVLPNTKDEPGTSQRTDRKLLELEAKLSAYRQVILILIRQLAAVHKGSEKFWEAFDPTVIVQDHEEDPGVEPTTAYASSSITAFELRRLVEEARAQ